MRKTALQEVLALAQRDDRVCFVGSDLGFGVMDDFRQLFPERLFREGVSEQHIVAMCAGLALEGKVVYINTIASFLTRRCFEQVYLDLGLHKTRVRLIGSGGGVVYAPLGPTHLAPDDLALMRSVPNMTIIAPCDAQEMHMLMPLTLDVDGPVYVRLAKGGDAVVSSPDADYALGKALWLTPQAQGDILLVTTGITAQIALEAARMLSAHNISASVLHCHTVKPLDTTALLQGCTHANTVVTIEEHALVGGLGSAVAELLAETPLPRPVRLVRVGFPDLFLSEHGSQNQIMEKYGISPAGVVQRVLHLER